MIEKKNILGVGITNASGNEILEYIVKNIENFKKKLFIATPNPEFLVRASKNSDFKNILNRADLASADGIGVIIAGKFLGRPLKGRFTGIDLVKNLCKRVAEKPITVGFLGGRAGVAEKTAECLRKNYPGLKVAFVQEEWPKAGKSGNIDILFVAFGAPKQEIWINENLTKIPVKVAIGVGGAFDYISGNVSRAPSWVQNIGLEWLYRLIVQPWRIKRQIALLEFIALVLKEKFKSSIA